MGMFLLMFLSLSGFGAFYFTKDDTQKTQYRNKISHYWNHFLQTTNNYWNQIDPKNFSVIGSLFGGAAILYYFHTSLNAVAEKNLASGEAHLPSTKKFARIINGLLDEEADLKKKQNENQLALEKKQQREKEKKDAEKQLENAKKELELATKKREESQKNLIEKLKHTEELSRKASPFAEEAIKIFPQK